MAVYYNSANSATPNSVTRRIANDIIRFKNAVANNLVRMGQYVEIEEDSLSMANKILAITGNVTVEPLQGIPEYWHNLADIMASFNSNDYPYAFAMLLNKNQESVRIPTAKYLSSDNQSIRDGVTDHTFNTAQDTIGQDTQATYVSNGVCGISTEITLRAVRYGAVGNVQLIADGNTVSNLINNYNASNPNNLLQLVEGDGTQIPLVRFAGSVAGATDISICQVDGSVFVGDIVLVADEVKSVDTLIADWNTANPDSQIELSSGSGIQIPTEDITLTPETITLTGGLIGNIGKETRWVMCFSANDDISCNYATQEPLLGNSLLHVYFGRISIAGFTFTSLRPMLTFEDHERETFNIAASAFASNPSTRHIKFPKADKITIGDSAFKGNTSLTSVEFQEGLEELTFSLGASNTQIFLNCLMPVFKLPSTLKKFTNNNGFPFTGNSVLRELIFPDGMTDLALNVLDLRGAAFRRFYLGMPSTTFTGPGTNNHGAGMTHFELGEGWNWSLNLTGLGNNITGLTAERINEDIFAPLADKRGDGVNPTTASSTTSSPVVTFTNGNCTKIFRVGDTITLTGITVKTILTIDSDNQVTLTANAGANLTNVAYNINKTITIGAVALALEGLTPEVATEKGFTVA
jgi:hypothetical protein